MKTFYESHLPHIHPKGAAFFVTFRLEGSIPKSELQKWEANHKTKTEDILKIKEEKVRNLELFNHRKRSFAIYDSLMDKIGSGPHHMKREQVMDIVKKQLHRFDGEMFSLIAYCIMSNHVHILIDTDQNHITSKLEKKLYDNHTELSYIMQRIKGASARYANQELGLSQKFWKKESYDMYIRNEKMLNNVIGYILDNPVKAGIVKDWKDYPGNYLMT